jgi:hypothetical protein
MIYSSYFSQPLLYVALACAGEEERGWAVQNSKLVLFTDQKLPKFTKVYLR